MLVDDRLLIEVEVSEFERMRTQLADAKRIIMHVKELGLYPWHEEIDPKTYRLKNLTEAAIDDWLKT